LDGIRSCVTDLRALLDGSAEEQLQRMTPAQTAVRNVLASADVGRARRQAQADMGYARRVLKRITTEINLLSVSPVLLFDAAYLRLQPGDLQPRGASGVRYAVGGGIRFSLVSAARLTVAYAVNPSPRPWERPGAFVFSLDVVDLFY